jgi:hypothetical protein
MKRYRDVAHHRLCRERLASAIASSTTSHRGETSWPRHAARRLGEPQQRAMALAINGKRALF